MEMTAKAIKIIKELFIFAGLVIVVSNNITQYSESIIDGKIMIFVATAIVALGALWDSELIKSLR